MQALALDPVIHQPTRLQIMAALYRTRECSFTDLRDTFGLTPGNLSSHATRLEEGGYIKSSRILVDLTFNVRYRITDAGAQAFRAYLADLKAFVEQSDLDAAPPAASPPSPGAVFLGKYDVERALGSGAFATAWLANHRGLERRIVIKQLHPAWLAVPEVRQRFEREARILAQLDHPGITGIYDIEQAGGLSYMVMEYVDGGSLEDRLQTGPLSLREAGPLMLDVLEGLDYIHARGVLHRDLKPSNILLTRAGRAKIADFGIARQAGVATTSLTLAGTPGTPQYMAPEQLEGHPGDARSDLYAAAATFYQALTGKAYFGEVPEDLAGLRRRVLEAPPAAVPGWSSGLNGWFAKALAKQPPQRYQRAPEMAADLRRVLQG